MTAKILTTPFLHSVCFPLYGSNTFHWPSSVFFHILSKPIPKSANVYFLLFLTSLKEMRQINPRYGYKSSRFGRFYSVFGFRDGKKQSNAVDWLYYRGNSFQLVRAWYRIAIVKRTSQKTRINREENRDMLITTIPVAMPGLILLAYLLGRK